MNPIRLINSQQTISNIPDLLPFHHNNPLGVSPLIQLIFIFVIAEVMAFFNYKIRYQDKQQYYPVIFTLLAICIIAVLYYGFQTGLPESVIDDLRKPDLGWFCNPRHVGWGWTIVSIIALTHVVYTILNATMQTVAELTVRSKFVEGKPWKEWKAGMYFALAGVVACGATSFNGGGNAFALTILICSGIFSLFVICKMVADMIRGKRILWSLLIAAVFYMGMCASVMLTIEAMRGGIALLLVIMIILTRAKARKKKPEKK